MQVATEDVTAQAQQPQRRGGDDVCGAAAAGEQADLAEPVTPPERGRSLHARLAEIHTPTLLIAAEDDMLVPASCSERLAEGLGEGPYARFWPHRHGTDAMFLALLRRH